MKYFLIIFAFSILLPLSACNASPINEIKPVVNIDNKTAEILKGKLMTSLSAETYLGEKNYNYLWCQYTGHINPNATGRLKSGVCYAGTNYPKTHYLRDFYSPPQDTIKFPKASLAELDQLKTALIKMDFANIQSAPTHPDSKQGMWFALFCYEDPKKTTERAECMEAFAPLTHPKTDAVLQALQRFAQGNSMDPRQ